jgi:butyryl-CoA dehydrogenase
MMNEARIGVGAGAVALGYTGYLHALSYARERTQGRPVADKDPLAPAVPLVRHPDVRRMLVASKAYVEGGLALVLYAAKLLDEPSPSNDLLLDVLTPIVKAWPSQWCRLANDHAIQIYGGYGYTREYPVEQFYRDNRLNSIHEGTDGIQGLDLLGRKVVMREGAGLRLLLSRIREDAASSPSVLEACDRLESVTARLWESGSPAVALANSTAYLEAAGHLVIAWMWISQLSAVPADSDDPFYAGKRLAARYFLTHELPRIGPLLDLLESRDTLFADLDEAHLG